MPDVSRFIVVGMDNDDPDYSLSPQQEAEKAAVFAEFTAAKGKRAPKIELVELVDLIDDCNWGDWACQYSLDGGATWNEGSVQSDGHLIAHETLTDDAGNPIK